MLYLSLSPNMMMTCSEDIGSIVTKLPSEPQNLDSRQCSPRLDKKTDLYVENWPLSCKRMLRLESWSFNLA